MERANHMLVEAIKANANQIALNINPQMAEEIIKDQREINQLKGSIIGLQARISSVISRNVGSKQ